MCTTYPKNICELYAFIQSVTEGEVIVLGDSYLNHAPVSTYGERVVMLCQQSGNVLVNVYPPKKFFHGPSTGRLATLLNSAESNEFALMTVNWYDKHGVRTSFRTLPPGAALQLMYDGVQWNALDVTNTQLALTPPLVALPPTGGTLTVSGTISLGILNTLSDIILAVGVVANGATATFPVVGFLPNDSTQQYQEQTVTLSAPLSVRVHDTVTLLVQALVQGEFEVHTIPNVTVAAATSSSLQLIVTNALTTTNDASLPLMWTNWYVGAQNPSPPGTAVYNKIVFHTDTYAKVYTSVNVSNLLPYGAGDNQYSQPGTVNAGDTVYCYQLRLANSGPYILSTNIGLNRAVTNGWFQNGVSSGVEFGHDSYTLILQKSTTAGDATAGLGLTLYTYQTPILGNPTPVFYPCDTCTQYPNNGFWSIFIPISDFQQFVACGFDAPTPITVTDPANIPVQGELYIDFVTLPSKYYEPACVENLTIAGPNLWYPVPAPIVPLPPAPTYTLAVGAISLTPLAVAPARLTRDGTPVIMSGVNRPGTEWCPMGWFHLPTEQLQAQINAMVSKWSCNAVRIPLNQAFWLSTTKLGSVYSDYYKSIIDMIVNACRSKCGGNSIQYIILDLHWTDCGWSGATNVQSYGSSCASSFGNNNGVYGTVGQQMLPDTNSVLFWYEVAQRYGQTTVGGANGDILFELHNEPFPFMDPNNPSGAPNNLTYNAANAPTIWTAWRDGPASGLPTTQLYNTAQDPTSGCNTNVATRYTVPLGTFTAPFASNVQPTVQTAGYVGLQTLLEVIRVAANARNVCIAGGIQFSYRLDGVVGEYPWGSGGTQYFLHVPGTPGTPASNVLYNAHPYTSQIRTPAPWPVGGNQYEFDVPQFDAAFGFFPRYGDLICTEFGNNAGPLVGISDGQCTSLTQQQINQYVDGVQNIAYFPDGAPATTINGLKDGANAAFTAHMTAWAWYADQCAFVSLLENKDGKCATSGSKDPQVQVDAYTTGQASCMGGYVQYSLLTRAGKTATAPSLCVSCPTNP